MMKHSRHYVYICSNRTVCVDETLSHADEMMRFAVELVGCIVER